MVEFDPMSTSGMQVYSRPRPMFFTNNPNLGSTARILQAWLCLCHQEGLGVSATVQRTGALTDWLRSEGTPCLIDSTPWMDLRKPWVAGWHAARVASWARRHGTQIFHFNEHDLYPFMKSLDFFRRLPTVCHVRYKLDREFAAWAFGGIHLPDALLWTSHQQKADSSTAVEGIVPSERQHVVRLGIDLSSFGGKPELGHEFRREWEIAPEAILIGIPAPLRPRKRIDDFVEMIRRLAFRHPQVVGIIAGGEIVGDEVYRRKIERQIEGSGLGSRLRWVGNLEPVEPFHHACDISISTSEYETFGNSVCEAMACGKPVAAYQGGSVGEVIGGAGVVVPTGDLDALTRAVDELIGNPMLQRSLGAAARRRVETEFSPTTSFKQLLGIYDSILKSKKQ